MKNKDALLSLLKECKSVEEFLSKTSDSHTLRLFMRAEELAHLTHVAPLWHLSILAALLSALPKKDLLSLLDLTREIFLKNAGVNVTTH